MRLVLQLNPILHESVIMKPLPHLDEVSLPPYVSIHQMLSLAEFERRVLELESDMAMYEAKNGGRNSIQFHVARN